MSTPIDSINNLPYVPFYSRKSLEARLRGFMNQAVEVTWTPKDELKKEITKCVFNDVGVDEVRLENNNFNIVYLYLVNEFKPTILIDASEEQLDYAFKNILSDVNGLVHSIKPVS